MGDPLDDAQKAMSLIGELKNIAGEHPDVKAGAQEAAKTFRTLTTFINNALLPLTAVNWTIQRAKEFFHGGEFEEEMRPRLSQIPFESIVEPKASIAGPVMQGLSFSIDEPKLKDMYMNLLKNSMDGREVNKVHPAYSEIVKQLSGDEVVFLNLFIHLNHNIPIFEIRRYKDESQKFASPYATRMRHILNITVNSEVEEDAKAVIVEKLSSYVENWIRLGLFEVEYNVSMESNFYTWCEKRPEFTAEQQIEMDNFPIVKVQNGIMKRTSFGKEFAAAIS